METPTENQGQAAQQEPARQTPFKSSTSPTIFKVATALAKAQGKYKTLVKNCEGKVTYQGRDGKQGGSYTFRYADLGAVIEATSEALASEELAHTAIISGGTIRVMLLHSSGEWMASDAQLTAGGGPQQFGSQVTYYRRYLLSPLLGVASEDDDDANGAVGNGFDKTEKPRQPAKAKEQPKDPPKDQPSEEDEHAKKKQVAMARLEALMVNKGIVGKDQLPWVSLQVEHNVAMLNDLTADEYKAVKAAAEKLPNKTEQGKAA